MGDRAFAPTIAESSAKILVAEKFRDGVPPFGLCIGEDAAILSQYRAVGSHGRRDRRNSAGHVLNQLVSGLSALERSVDERHDPDVETLDLRDFAVLGPIHEFHARK